MCYPVTAPPRPVAIRTVRHVDRTHGAVAPWHRRRLEGVHHSLIPLAHSCRASCVRPLHEEVRGVSTRKGGVVMKLLFAIRNKVSAQKSLKASAWYFWY
ncbi:tryptorubin family RiPP precursor [Streptomyces sp. NPDC001219]